MIKMKRLIVGAVLSYDLDAIDASPDDYTIDEVVEMLRLEMQDRYAEFDLQIDVRDYLVEQDDYSVEW
jgi:hypothetical protein